MTITNRDHKAYGNIISLRENHLLILKQCAVKGPDVVHQCTVFNGNLACLASERRYMVVSERHNG